MDPKPTQKCQEGVPTDFENKHVQELMGPPWIVDAVIHLGGASRIADNYPDSHYTEHNVGTTKQLQELYSDVSFYRYNS